MRRYKRHSCEHVVTGCCPTALTMNYDERMMTSLLLFSWLSIASAETTPSVPTEPNDGDNPVSTEEEANASESENESPDGAESDSTNASDASDEPVENPENSDRGNSDELRKVLEVTFRNAYPVRMGEIQLQSDAFDSRLEFQVSFYYETLTFDGLLPIR